MVNRMSRRIEPIGRTRYGAGGRIADACNGTGRKRGAAWAGGSQRYMSHGRVRTRITVRVFMGCYSLWCWLSIIRLPLGHYTNDLTQTAPACAGGLVLRIKRPCVWPEAWFLFLPAGTPWRLPPSTRQPDPFGWTAVGTAPCATPSAPSLRDWRCTPSPRSP